MEKIRKIQIRELNDGDTEQFLALKTKGLTSDSNSFVAAIGEDSPTYPQEVKQRLEKASVSNGDIILGAFDRDLVGIVSITRHANLKRQHKADLHGMYVVPEYRGIGLGKTLLIKSLEMAKNMVALEEIQLIVAVHNQSVVALYENLGFVHCYKELRALKTDDGYIDAYHMSLSIQR